VATIATVVVSGCGTACGEEQSVVAGRVELPSMRTWYDERGEGEPLALLHGGVVDARFFDQNIDAIARVRPGFENRRTRGRNVGRRAAAWRHDCEMARRPNRRADRRSWVGLLSARFGAGVRGATDR
jgi:hypothetical protein